MLIKALSFSKPSRDQLLIVSGLFVLLTLTVASNLFQKNVVMVKVDGIERESHIVGRGPACASSQSNAEFEKLMRDLPVRGYLAP